MDFVIRKTEKKEAAAVLELQKAAYITEAKLYNQYDMPPLTQTLTNIRKEFSNHIFLGSYIDEVLAGTVRARMLDNETCYVRRLAVYEKHRSVGIGRALMNAIENEFPKAKYYKLETGYKSDNNIIFYHSLGYREYSRERVSDKVILIYMKKEKNCH